MPGSRRARLAHGELTLTTIRRSFASHGGPAAGQLPGGLSLAHQPGPSAACWGAAYPPTGLAHPIRSPLLITPQVSELHPNRIAKPATSQVTAPINAQPG